MTRLLVSAIGAAFALALAGPAGAQDAPGHCPSISNAQLKQILAPYSSKYGARNVLGLRQYSVSSSQGFLWIYVYTPSRQLRKGFPHRLPMQNLCPLTPRPSKATPSWWPSSVPPSITSPDAGRSSRGKPILKP
jgi:hypothetical protein